MQLLYRLYHFSISCYGLAIRIAGMFMPKARKWTTGRRNWQQQLQQEVKAKEGPWIWFHCASLGEFEQGRNLLEAIRSAYPKYRIILSFFSPSGYEIRKNYAHADYVCYLPLDTPGNARMWLEILNPELIFFIKYELWLHYLREIRYREIPFILVSARVRKTSGYFKWPFSSLYKEAYKGMKALFTQDEISAQLLDDFTAHPRIIVSSDTRYDRVASNRATANTIPEIEQFRRQRLCIVCGSTWPKGEQGLLAAFESLRQRFDLCMILAPHEIHLHRIEAREAQFPKESIRYSQIKKLRPEHRILWIDNIGMLSRLYAYGDLAYVGGAWGTGLHNILEAAVFGCPVIIGPRHSRFPEAQALIDAGGAFSVPNESALLQQIEILLSQPELRDRIHRINEDFINQRVGATNKVLTWCETAGLLVS